MPSRREAIEMTPAEVSDYLREQTRVILVTNGPDGMPHPMPMNYGVDGQGRVVMTSFAKAQKVVMAVGIGGCIVLTLVLSFYAGDFVDKWNALAAQYDEIITPMLNAK